MNYQKQLENLFNNILVIIYNILPHPNCSERQHQYLGRITNHLRFLIPF